ncbi:NfeD family protein [Orbaceae bacterium ESL0727]|nr:NfeD family protein [Orbaceae bacterium ESL0727]
MNEFLSTIYQSPNWFFMTLGGILLICELLSACSGYALWSGIAALVVGLFAWVIPLSWSTLWLLFAIFTLIAAYLWWMWLKKHNQKQPIAEQLNQPQKALIGIKTVVVEPIQLGSGRVKINDGTWPAKCQEDLPKGTPVQIVAVEGLVVQVVKI